MNVLVTAGNTAVPIDQVRVISNVFTGRTGALLALHGHNRGHQIILLTSHPEVVGELQKGRPVPETGWRLIPYRTFDEFQDEMEAVVRSGGLDVVIHSAAVSDFQNA